MLMEMGAILAKFSRRFPGTPFTHWTCPNRLSFLISSSSLSFLRGFLGVGDSCRCCLTLLSVLFKFHQSHPFISIMLKPFPSKYGFRRSSNSHSLNPRSFFFVGKRKRSFVTGAAMIITTHTFKNSVVHKSHKHKKRQFFSVCPSYRKFPLHAAVRLSESRT